jgi:hypothetical protein
MEIATAVPRWPAIADGIPNSLWIVNSEHRPDTAADESDGTDQASPTLICPTSAVGWALRLLCYVIVDSTLRRGGGRVHAARIHAPALSMTPIKQKYTTCAPSTSNDPSFYSPSLDRKGQAGPCVLHSLVHVDRIHSSATACTENWGAGNWRLKTIHWAQGIGRCALSLPQFAVRSSCNQSLYRGEFSPFLEILQLRQPPLPLAHNATFLSSSLRACTEGVSLVSCWRGVTYSAPPALTPTA